MMWPDHSARLIIPHGWRKLGTTWAWLWREQPLHCCFPGHDLSKWPRSPGQCSLLAGMGWWGGRGEQTAFRRMEISSPLQKRHLE